MFPKVTGNRVVINCIVEQQSVNDKNALGAWMEMDDKIN